MSQTVTVNATPGFNDPGLNTNVTTEPFDPAKFGKPDASLADDKNKPVDPPADPPADPPKPNEPPKGIDTAKYTQEFTKDGKLSDASYQELSDKGIPKEMVDAYIQGLQAKATNERGELLKEVGGDDGYNKLIEWAAQGLTKEEIEQYDSAVSSNDPKQIKLAVSWLKATHQSRVGREPSLVNGGKPSGTVPFSNEMEAVRFMGDERYGKDSVYTKSVDERLQASPGLFGIRVS